MLNKIQPLEGIFKKCKYLKINLKKSKMNTSIGKILCALISKYFFKQKRENLSLPWPLKAFSTSKIVTDGKWQAFSDKQECVPYKCVWMWQTCLLMCDTVHLSCEQGWVRIPKCSQRQVLVLLPCDIWNFIFDFFFPFQLPRECHSRHWRGRIGKTFGWKGSAPTSPGFQTQLFQPCPRSLVLTQCLYVLLTPSVDISPVSLGCEWELQVCSIEVADSVLYVAVNLNL